MPTDDIGSRARIVNQVLTQCEWVNARILAVAPFVESICAGKYTTATDFERTITHNGGETQHGSRWLREGRSALALAQ